MKYISCRIFCLAVLTLVLTSCVKDQYGSNEDKAPSGMPATLSLASRAMMNLADDRNAYLDYHVTGLRVMGYDTYTGRLVFNSHVTPTSDGSNTSAGANKDVRWSSQVNVITGNFTIIIIANESVDPDLAAILGDNAKVAALADLHKLTIDRTALKWDGVIPMLGVYENVRIIGNNSLEIGGTAAPAPWEVELKHVAVRVDLTLNLEKAQADLLEAAARIDNWVYSLYVENIPQKQYLFPGMDNSIFAREQQAYYAKWGNPGYPNAAGLIEKELVTEDYTIIFPRLILPESYFADQTNKNKALTISTYISNDGTTKIPISGTIGYNIDPAKGPMDYTLPRNTYLSVDATMKVHETYSDLGMKIEVAEWDSGYYEDVTPGTYFFSVDSWEPEYNENVKDDTFFINIVATHPDGWTWEAHYEEVPVKEWILVFDLSEIGMEGGALISIERYQILQGLPTQYRTGYLHLKSGNLTKVIKFVQESQYVQ